LIIQDDLELLQQQLDLSVQQVQTISDERDIATTVSLQSNQDLVNLRFNFDEIIAEKNAR
jgi:hypothetical protein